MRESPERAVQRRVGPDRMQASERGALFPSAVEQQPPHESADEFTHELRPEPSQVLAQALAMRVRRWRSRRARAFLRRSARRHAGASHLSHHFHLGRRRAVGLVLFLLLSALVVSQANGPLGAQSADLLRAILGPQATAQIEAWYLALQDTEHQLQYQLSGKKTTAPWQPGGPMTSSSASSSSSAATAPSSSSSPPQRPHLVPSMPLSPLRPVIQPALPGEGVWDVAGVPQPAAGQPPLVAKSFLRPDPARPYAMVTLLQFDLRFTTLHLVAGTSEPGGARGVAGPGKIPATVQQDNTLLAAFNGGFKYADGQYGMMVDGTVYVPPKPGAATIAVTKDGQTLLGAWGSTPQLSSSNPNLLAWRQNAAPLITDGQINPLTNDGAAWGGTILNSTYTWRSGIGLTSHDTLIYAAGNSLSAATLAKALQAAGAVEAMQTDINPFWVRAFLYQRDASGALQITKLHPGMQGTGREYL
ncbi:MAG TPA: phosphodiester glycosidase family protein, partial [Ktedonobacterales bacterium]|nr:phosphodiester glycosidase family protein [Ktedonobacterales bacterium]